VTRIELLWPSGVHQTIERPAVNTVLTIEETVEAKA
jgi:hypothetical protein